MFWLLITSTVMRDLLHELSFYFVATSQTLIDTPQFNIILQRITIINIMT